MNIESFARQYRLKIRHDDCNDPVIYGKTSRRDSAKGERQLYFDGDELCLMVLDGALVLRSRWEALGGKLWLGDLSADADGKRVQDVKVTGIPLTNARLAIRLARVRQRRVMSDAHQAALIKAGTATRMTRKSE